MKFEHGVVIVATGAYELETDEYLHGKSDKVITQRDLEDLLAKKDAKVAKAESVVMIQCVGSRTKERPYCSRYCCSEAMKNALKIKEMDPNKDVTVIYRDVRTFGLKEDYYKKARELNVKFVRYDEDRKPEVMENGGKLAIKVFDPIMNAPVTIECRHAGLKRRHGAEPGKRRDRQDAQGPDQPGRLLPRGTREAPPGGLSPQTACSCAACPMRPN